MKKTLLALVVLFVSAFTLFALEGNVTWVWFENNPNVEYYRYQLDGEEDDKWTVVDWTVTEVTYTLDVTVLHTLYLQQSYDGINWSSSSYTESEIYYEAEEPIEETIEEELFDDFEFEEPAAEEPVEDEVVEATVIEDEIILPEVEAEKKYQPLVALDFGLGFMNSIPDADGPKTVGFNASYSRTFVKAGIFDIGFKADLGVYTSKDLFRFKHWSDGSWMESWQLKSYTSCLALATTRVGNCDVYGAIGPDFSYTYGKAVGNSGEVGLEMEVGVRYHRFGNLSIGFSICDHQYFFSLFGGEGMENRMELKSYLGLSF